MNYVFDACAMIAFLRGERGDDVVREILLDPASHCVAHAINLCEVYYDFVRVSDAKTARAAVRDLTKIGIQQRRDISTAFWMGVGQLKGTIRKVSLADCFAIELARQMGAQIVTSDHHEFDPLASQRICAVRFIR
jgi:PIN domain nuclease of toxin-antitoxin system